MKYALVGGERAEPKPKLSGECPGCGSPMIAKCGDEKVWHWAHHGKRKCDHWWENETEWHRAWKGFFPKEWQEVFHPDEGGKWHVADVKTDQGWVLEFQHSRISPEERQSRNDFYKKLVWIVDGTRRPTDVKQFNEVLEFGTNVSRNAPIIKTPPFHKCRLLKEWGNSRVPVLFDFKEAERLWWLLPQGPDGSTFIWAFPRDQFIHIHRGSDERSTKNFTDLVEELPMLISNFTTNLQAQARAQHRQMPTRAQFARPRRSRRF